MKNAAALFAGAMKHILPHYSTPTSKAVKPPSRPATETPWHPSVLLPVCAVALVNLPACTSQSGSMSLQGKPLSGYVDMTQVQAAYIGSGNAGTGTLRY